MLELLFPPDKHEITTIKFFTARIDKRGGDTGAPLRQAIYLRALEAYRPEIKIIYGKFLSHPAMRPYAPPENGWARVMLTEEKGTDVNLAVHMLNDAWRDIYDCAIVVSNDSDLAEAVRLAKEIGKSVGWLVTGQQHPSQVLAQIADFRKPIRKSVLMTSQLPDTIPGTSITKPSVW